MFDPEILRNVAGALPLREFMKVGVPAYADPSDIVTANDATIPLDVPAVICGPGMLPETSAGLGVTATLIAIGHVGRLGPDTAFDSIVEKDKNEYILLSSERPNNCPLHWTVRLLKTGGGPPIRSKGIPFKVGAQLVPPAPLHHTPSTEVTQPGALLIDEPGADGVKGPRELGPGL
jgi:hypothetical protein